MPGYPGAADSAAGAGRARRVTARIASRTAKRHPPIASRSGSFASAIASRCASRCASAPIASPGYRCAIASPAIVASATAGRFTAMESRWLATAIAIATATAIGTPRLRCCRANARAIPSSAETFASGPTARSPPSARSRSRLRARRPRTRAARAVRLTSMYRPAS